MAEPLGQPYRDEWGNVWQDYPGDNGQPNSVLIEMNNYPGQNRGASPGYGQLGAPSASGQDRYGSGGYGQSPMGQTVGNPDRFGSSGYGTYTTGGNYTGVPAAPAAAPVAPAPVSNEYVAPVPAPVYAPAPGYAPASSPMPAMPLPPPPPPRSNWSMKIGERLGAFNPAQGAGTLRLPQNLPGRAPAFMQPGQRPPMPGNLPSYPTPGTRPVLPPLPNLPRR